MRAYYDKIYLVATEDCKTSSFRVTTREEGKRPGTVSFSGNHPMPNGVETYSSLVLSEDKWEEWFGGRKMLRGYETPASAAETLVKGNKNVHYGCPLCSARFKDRKLAGEHIDAHVNTFISQFRIEEE